MSKHLNPQQLDAVQHMEGPLLVIAGAGAGKTGIVTQRIARLIELGVPASSILAVTFTNKAAGEMKERVLGLTTESPLISTFHSLGARILRESIAALGYTSDFNIYDEEDSNKLIRACMDELGASKKTKPKTVKALISDAKNRLVPPEEVEQGEGNSEAEKIFPEVYDMYQARMREYNALDFDDLLFVVVRLFQECPEVLEMYQNRWHYLLIDEYQDTNRAQYMMARYLVEKSNNIFVVGDPDQSIYSWRGANIENILNFEEDYKGAKVVRLEQNYRSTNTILSAANALIENNSGRYEKNLWSNLGEGAPIKLSKLYDEREEAEWIIEQANEHHVRDDIPFSDMVVFYRTNAQSRQFEDALLRKRIPYVIVGGMSFYQRREIKDILAYLRVIHSSADFLSFARSINLPKRGIGPTTLEKLRMGAHLAELPIIDYCMKGEMKLSKKQQEGINDYLTLVEQMRVLEKEGDLVELVHQTIERSGYLGYLKEDLETYQDRKENLDQLISKAAENESLQEFLEELSLKSSLDEASMEEERLNLMTLHNGKGLEFAVTFLAGMEEGLAPHASTQGDYEAIEEERRLVYVGMTRAKRFLYMTSVSSRFLWGSRQMVRPSRFLNEVPKRYVTDGKKERFSFQQEEVVYEEEAGGDFVAGDVVMHRDFGPGQIQEVASHALGPIYKILFRRDHQVRTLVAKYANLTRA